MKKTLHTCILAASVLGASASTTFGAFTIIDNFEGLATGGLNEKNGWTAEGSFTVETDPANAGNQVVKLDRGSTSTAQRAYKSLSATIANGSSGTLFQRFRYESNADAPGGGSNSAFGLSPVATPGTGGTYGSFKTLLNIQHGAAGLRVRDAGTAEELTTPAKIDTTGVYYNLWTVIDNDADTYEVYVQRDGDANFSTQTLITSGTDPNNFRENTTDGDLATFLFVGQNGVTYLDDLYIDNTGTNLANPTIPEPSAALLSLLGAAILLRRKRN